ncbi:type IV secretory system conjugative DNA transfer family protein [Rathayibacter sp. VKM Ac-2760]|uniref:type IV secretory system conjugative DNA transfer family protein n=1 Tax=Rathayibacter sp. VKM Ac-2760 TaxID=2609253 RepID=UPI0013163F45|nr:type IV secretory system conjugative DNA transfer family protein [Rathayibacter sp. VKM Ac-2760]QHC61099.1 TraM recognition domain-containing protein [Rathayibacter sp. VKM Ac-2760]
MSATANNRRREPGKANNDGLMLGAAVTAIAIVGIVWVSVAAGSKLDGVNEGLTSDPFEILSGLARGTVTWSSSATMIAAAAGGIIVLVALWFLWMKALGRKGRANVDRAARYMATERDLAPMLSKEAMKKSKRLGVEGSPGVPVGRLVSTGKMLYASFEDMITVVAGPRVGKSTSLVIPAIIAAPGAVVTTSNKRDVLDATRDVREKDGPVWVFDPQRVAREDATWWWNPLSYVTDDVRAAKLAQYFASGSRATDAKTDAFFDGAGQNLLAGMLLAAAVGQKPISQVFAWLTDVTNEEPVRLLRSGGYPMTGDAVLGIIQSTEKLRGSVYSTAQEMAACLKNTQVADWVNPRGTADPRPQFDAATFVRGSGTLYSLSKEGAGTAGPLVTALTAATLEAATDLADISPGGRLRTPLVGILDEAANVCRWRDLPDLYSHFGSRGIPIMSVFQSWSQGVAVFGKEGMLKLWSASNAFLYLGSVKENDFLQNVSELVGDYDRETTSASYNKGVRSTSTALKRERILTVDELGAMPRGRAVMLSTGSRAALLRTVPWYEGTKEKVSAIKASIAAHDPAIAPVRGAERAPVVAMAAQPVVTSAEPVVASVEPVLAIDLAASMRALMENEDAKRTRAQRD